MEVDNLKETIAELRERGVAFEEYDVPGLETVNGIAEVEGNYPSKGASRRRPPGSRTARQPTCHRSSRELSTPVPRAAGGDRVRQSVAWMARELMEAELSTRIGAELGERSLERTTHRNGYRPRAWDTRVGSIELAIPKLGDVPRRGVEVMEP